MINLKQQNNETYNQHTAISNMSQYLVEGKKKKKNLESTIK